MTGAKLDGASLVGADLRKAWLQCAELDQLLLSNDRAAGKCPSARNADFFRAKLDNAHMSGIDLSGAKLDEAKFEGADLGYSTLTGMSFKRYLIHI